MRAVNLVQGTEPSGAKASRPQLFRPQGRVLMSDEKALVQAGQSRSAGLTAFVGTLAEIVQAHQQIAQSIAASQAFPGYDSLQKVMAACWAAHALAVHPVAYMSGVYAADMGGKMVMIPKVQFEDGLLRSRLPGYDYIVHQNDEKACDLEFFAAGRKPQRVRYTLEQAQAAELTKKDTYKKYMPQMLFARCFHIGTRRIGPHILAGLPDPMDYDTVAPADLVDGRPGREPSAATVLDEAAVVEPAAEAAGVSEGAAPSSPVATPSAERIPGAGEGTPRATSVPTAGVPSQPIVDWHATLSATLKRVFPGRMTKEQILEKASTVWKAIQLERGLPAPEPFKKARDFGPVEAEQMVAWLRAKYPKETAGEAAVAAGSTDAPPAPPAEQPAEPERTASAGHAYAEAEPAADDDEAPPLADAAAEAERLSAEADQRVEVIFALANAAKKSHPGRVFVQESPVGTGSWWFVDKDICTSRGHTSGVHLQKNGEQRVSASECALLARMMREAGVVA